LRYQAQKTYKCNRLLVEGTRILKQLQRQID
jgi:hypothetical protein